MRHWAGRNRTILRSGGPERNFSETYLTYHYYQDQLVSRNVTELQTCSFGEPLET